MFFWGTLGSRHSYKRCFYTYHPPKCWCSPNTPMTKALRDGCQLQPPSAGQVSRHRKNWPRMQVCVFVKATPDKRIETLPPWLSLKPRFRLTISITQFRCSPQACTKGERVSVKCAAGCRFSFWCWPSPPFVTADCHSCDSPISVCVRVCLCALQYWFVCVTVYRGVHLVAIKTHIQCSCFFPSPAALSPHLPTLRRYLEIYCDKLSAKLRGRCPALAAGHIVASFLCLDPQPA